MSVAYFMSVAITIVMSLSGLAKDTIINGLSVDVHFENFLRCWDLPGCGKTVAENDYRL